MRERAVCGLGRAPRRRIGLCGMWAAALVVAGPAPASAQDTFVIRGTVTDAVRGAPLDRVRVVLPTLGRVTETGPDGTFILPPLPKGTYPLTLVREGYARVEGDLEVVEDGDFSVQMERLPDDPARGRLQGRVFEAGSGRPLGAVTVSVAERATETGPKGLFVVRNLEPGSYPVRFARLGYAPRTDTLRVESGRITHAVVPMATRPVELAGLTVEVESRTLRLDRAGFYQRKARETGLFLSREDLEARNPLVTTDILEGRPGVHIERVGLDWGVVLRGGRGGRVVGLGRGGCGPIVWLDGVPLPRRVEGPTTINDLVTPDQLEGIEIYRSAAEMPARYNGPDSACGVVVLWTR